MDVSMPDMNGIEATRQIKKDCPSSENNRPVNAC